ncbi:hypothetical protein CONLIGDRAFT_643132 [Coniochaeta ligniaria NRRL 30616]|uniref:Uncharacterized protein n=1 Tax=Coniochaeta ligniaria NRRL 30616 TaxID=1408157 RepID=A0A1J7IUW9_9PEZI|nr:hypothetical protein CONLIGDRAFT_643132 [Coniochaeta ligniaria NRRL 30616]
MADQHASSGSGRAQDSGPNNKLRKWQHTSSELRKDPKRQVPGLFTHASALKTVMITVPDQDSTSNPTRINTNGRRSSEDSQLDTGIAVNRERDDDIRILSAGTDNSEQDVSRIPNRNPKSPSTQRAVLGAKSLYCIKQQRHTEIGKRGSESSHEAASQPVINDGTDQILTFDVPAHYTTFGQQDHSTNPDSGPRMGISNKTGSNTCDIADLLRGNNNTEADGSSPDQEPPGGSSESGESDSDTNNYTLCGSEKIVRHNDRRCSHPSHRQ